MRIRLLTTAAGVAVIAAALPSHAAAPAAPAAVTIADPAGDGNGINGQGPGDDDVPSTSTPAGYDAGDIVGISFQTLTVTKKAGKKTVLVPSALQVKMTLKGAPGTNTIYRVTPATADCTTFYFNWSHLADGSPQASLQHNCPGFKPTGTTGTSESVQIDAKVDANSITWTVPGNMLPSSIKVGTAFTGLGGHTRLYAGTTTTGGATVPQIDVAKDAAKTYVWGK